MIPIQNENYMKTFLFLYFEMSLPYKTMNPMNLDCIN